MIVLTGASGGIGQAILPDLEKIDKVIKVYNKTQVSDGYYLDLEYLNQIKGFARNIEQGKLTLIHLAAVKIDELAVFVNENNWDKVMGVNLKGAFFLSRELIPIMQRQMWGRIIFIISSGLGDVGTATYSASKFALLGLSEVLSKEYARFGITSNILQLGYFDTGLYRKLSDSKKAELLNQIPSKKLGDASNIVNAVEFLMKSDFVTGAVLNVDGGI